MNETETAVWSGWRFRLCNSICFFSYDMSKDAYEKGKQKSGTRLTVGAFYHVGKAVTLGVRQTRLTPHHIILFLTGLFLMGLFEWPFLAGSGLSRISLGV